MPFEVRLKDRCEDKTVSEEAERLAKAPPFSCCVSPDKDPLRKDKFMFISTSLRVASEFGELRLVFVCLLPSDMRSAFGTKFSRSDSYLARALRTLLTLGPTRLTN